MHDDWEARVRDFWISADETKISETLAEMEKLVSELEHDNPRGLFEWASAHDFLGLEAEAIPLYEKALELGLDGLNREKAVIQLASSLRNVGQAEAAIRWLLSEMYSEPMRKPAQAFLALAKYDAGFEPDISNLDWLEKYPDDALYSRSIRYYYDVIKNS